MSKALCEKCGRNSGKVTKHTEAYCKECPETAGKAYFILIPTWLQEWLDENYPEGTPDGI